MIFTVIIKFLIENVIFIFGYISNGNLFPEPLSAKEEEMYFKLYKNGDEERVFHLAFDGVEVDFREQNGHLLVVDVRRK